MTAIALKSSNEATRGSYKVYIRSHVVITMKHVVLVIGILSLIGEITLNRYCYVLEIAFDVVNCFKNESEMR